MKKYKIAVIKGDGIGPEIVDEAIKVLDAVCVQEGIELDYKEYLMGGAAIDIVGEPLPEETLKGAAESDATLFGAIGGDKWNSLPKEKRPESGLLRLREALGVYANLRPAIAYDELIEASPLKENIIRGVDILIVRELTGGIYFGKPRAKDEDSAYNTMIYSSEEIRRIAKIAFEAALKRDKKVCSVDKSNVLEVSQLWREVVEETSKEYPDVELTHMYVDNAAMQIIRNPKQFDVMLTGNLFGDILSDEASIIGGSIGLLPSASIGGKCAIYEPIHGSAPDIAGQGISNPIGTIASAAMMLEYSLGESKAAKKIEDAIKKTLELGYRTKDIANYGAKEVCSTSEMGSIIANLATKNRDK